MVWPVRQYLDVNANRQRTVAIYRASVSFVMCHQEEIHEPSTPPAISGRGIRGACHGVPVGLGIQHPWLGGDMNHRGMVTIVPFRHPLWPSYGLPHAAA